MSWAWTRTFYASKDSVIYNFEMKRQREMMLSNIMDLKKCFQRKL